jgi:hypothetical protein
MNDNSRLTRKMFHPSVSKPVKLICDVGQKRIATITLFPKEYMNKTFWALIVAVPAVLNYIPLLLRVIIFCGYNFSPDANSPPDFSTGAQTAKFNNIKTEEQTATKTHLSSQRHAAITTDFLLIIFLFTIVDLLLISFSVTRSPQLVDKLSRRHKINQTQRICWVFFFCQG